MNETLKLLYDRFYISLPMAESEQEVETCHRQLIERLDKPERKLVLRIIDAQNLMIEQRSMDSFICGFRLAWEMANDLNHYMEERPEPEDDLGPDALLYSPSCSMASLLSRPMTDWWRSTWFRTLPSTYRLVPPL